MSRAHTWRRKHKRLCRCGVCGTDQHTAEDGTVARHTAITVTPNQELALVECPGGGERPLAHTRHHTKQS